MDSDSGHDGDDYLPGSQCFRKRRSSVRAMVDEEDPVWGESAEETNPGQVVQC